LPFTGVCFGVGWLAEGFTIGCFSFEVGGLAAAAFAEISFSAGAVTRPLSVLFVAVLLPAALFAAGALLPAGFAVLLVAAGFAAFAGFLPEGFTADFGFDLAAGFADLLFAFVVPAFPTPFGFFAAVLPRFAADFAGDFAAGLLAAFGALFALAGLSAFAAGAGAASDAPISERTMLLMLNPDFAAGFVSVLRSVLIFVLTAILLCRPMWIALLAPNR
jgi:hypothetical protein